MLKRFLNAAQSNPQLASGFKQKLGIGGAPSSPPQGGMMPPPPRPPQGMRMPKLFGNAMPGPTPPMGPPPQGGMMPPPPQGMRMRPPMMTNKARGTMASHFRGPIGML